MSERQAKPRVAFVGVDGALGSALAGPLHAKPVMLRSPDMTQNEPLPELADADVVINAAGPRYLPELRWSDYLREHVGTATRVARSVRPGGYLVHLSSAAVYGAGRAYVRVDSPEEPSSFPSEAYAWAKLSAEYAARAVCRERGVALTVVRPSIVYGPGCGGVLQTLATLARRGARVVLRPDSLRQHLVHVDVLRAALEALVARGPAEDIPLLVAADPFVLTTADVNDALRRASGWSAAIPFPIDLCASAASRWSRRFDVQGPSKLTVAAMLALDNEYEWRPLFDRLCLDPSRFDRRRFEAFLADR